MKILSNYFFSFNSFHFGVCRGDVVFRRHTTVMSGSGLSQRWWLLSQHSTPTARIWWIDISRS